MTTGALVGGDVVGGFGGVEGVGGVGAVGSLELIVISVQFQNCSGLAPLVSPVVSYGYEQSTISEARSHPSSSSLLPTDVSL